MKKFYISADIEGVAAICSPNEINKALETEFAPFAAQMTAEVGAACTGAYAAGVDAVLIKDAHWTGRNIIPGKLQAPDGKSLQLIRGWSGHPFMMVQELDQSYHAAAFIGYHSPGGSGGNPLSHTISGGFPRVMLNDAVASEFLLYAYAAATVGVPVVFLSGDKAICDEGRRLIDGLETVETLEGIGSSVKSILPDEAIRRIERGVKKVLDGKLPATPTLPTDFSLRITFAKTGAAYARSFYPQVKQLSDTELLLETKTYMDVLAFIVYAAGFNAAQI